MASSVKNALKIESETDTLRAWAVGQRSAAIATAQRGLTDARKLTHVGVAISAADRSRLVVDDIPELIHEITGGEGEKGGG